MNRLVVLFAIVFAIVALAAASCASSKPEPERERVFLTDTSQFTWTGHSVDEVLEVFGRPSSRAPDGTGLTVLTYDEIRGIADTGTGSRLSTTDSGDQGTNAVPEARAPGDRTLATKVQIQFWIDNEGKVQRFYVSPEMYRRGVPSPPAGAPAGS